MIFAYEVDIQNDFMNKANGRLYVEGAEEIKPEIAKLVDMLEESGTRRIRSRDRHFKEDLELEINGGPFPFHCMDKSYNQINQNGMYGVDFIPELKTRSELRIENRAYTKSEIKDFVRSLKDLVLEKQHYDVFTNPNSNAVFEEMLTDGFNEAIVYGVATNVCVLAAVKGLQQRGIKTYVVNNAIAGVPDEYAPTSNTDAISIMKESGAKFVESQYIAKLIKGN